MYQAPAQILTHVVNGLNDAAKARVDKHAARKMAQRTRHEENHIPPTPQNRLAIVIPNK